MPNPLLGAQRNTSKRIPFTRAGEYTGPEAVAPVQEHESGVSDHVFAYRGTETHGVEPTADSTMLAGGDDTVTAFVEKATPEPDPIPVRVVNESLNELKTFRTYQTLANSQPQRILGRDKERTKAQLRVRSADLAGTTVWVSHTDNGGGANTLNAYPLSADTDFPIAAHDDVWIFLQGAANFTVQVPVYVYVETSLKE